MKAEGAKAAITRAKTLYVLTLRYITKQEIIRIIPGPATGPSGFPSCIVSLKRLLDSGAPGAKRSILTLLAHYRNIEAPGNPDFRPIVQPGIETPKVIEGKVRLTIKGDNSFPKIVLSDLPAPVLEYTSKSGPNGPALRDCMKDLSAFHHDRELYDTLT